jgi:hypothetical protein
MKTSPSGAPIMSGAGVAAVRKKLEEAFAEIRITPDASATQPTMPPQEPTQEAPQHQEMIYTEQHETRFHERAKRLSLAALSSPHTLSHDKKGVWNIEVPNETVEELFKAALRRDE